VAAGHGDYPEAFAELLGPQGVDLVTYDVQKGPVPTDPRRARRLAGERVGVARPTSRCRGSTPVEAFLRPLIEVEAPLVAVCFGHQLLAQAMGGRVERSDKGWGVGVHRYELLAHLPVDGPARPGPRPHPCSSPATRTR
jgi:GMP synthase-like glutamine amidotransferase